MVGRKLQDIWREQCEAARGVSEQHGVVAALDYLLAEMLMTYAELAVTRPEFARGLPRIVGEIRNIYSAEEIQLFTEQLERMDAQEDEAVSAKPADDDTMIETPEQRAAARERLARLKELLTASVLGTG